MGPGGREKAPAAFQRRSVCLRQRRHWQAPRQRGLARVVIELRDRNFEPLKGCGSVRSYLLFQKPKDSCASFRSARALARANAHSERSRDPTKRLVRGTAVYRLPFGTCGPRVFASDGAQKLRSQDTGTGGRKDDPKVHWPTSWPLKFCLTCMLVMLTLCSSVRDTDMGETRTRRRTPQRDDLAPRSACCAVVSTPQAPRRETVEGSLSHVRSAMRVWIGVALAGTAETSRTVPLSARSLRGALHSADWRSACGNCGNSPWSACGLCARPAAMHIRACMRAEFSV